MQQFLLVFVLFLDIHLISTLENPLHRLINISSSSLNHTTNNSSFSISTINDFDHPQIRTALNQFIKWFTPISIIFSLFIALVCPFLLWILQERCLYSSSNNRNSRSTTLITTPRLLLIDPRTNLPKSHSSSLNKTIYYSPDSSKQRDSYHTSRTSFSSVDTMV